MDIFENICRTCGNDCLDAMNIFVDSVTVLEKSVPISELLSTCMPTSATLPALSKNDDYPKQICRVCIKKLIMVYEFNNKWITANNEFNVALKFEQRRNRSRLSQPMPTTTLDEQMPIKCTVKTVDANVESIAADTAGIKAESIVFKHEPHEGTEIGTLINTTDMDHDLAPKNNVAIAQTINYQCALCDECYHTLAAYQKHHKVSHRNSQFLYYTPGQ
ncbi:uncharacterized protein LOC115764284 [Drosophila novamexicana]|uniref:uncharacterized protein LOC115764284 n=1 Tax=Drosophila novamexicana TaxID=47314 RepID=UPI0011E5CCAD|nr:uncharacterized protein LOC115764284 [Drosophila novamexicana]